MNILFGVLGIAGVSGAVMLFQAHRRWKATAVKVTGKVTAVRRSEIFLPLRWRGRFLTATRHKTPVTVIYLPTVWFEAEGRVVEFASKLGSSKRQEVGQDIGVYYQRDNPDDAEIEGPGRKAVMAVILGVTGLILLAASVMW